MCLGKIASNNKSKNAKANLWREAYFGSFEKSLFRSLEGWYKRKILHQTLIKNKIDFIQGIAVEERGFTI